MFEIFPGIASIYQSPENPTLKVFDIEGQADFYSLAALNSGVYTNVFGEPTPRL
jgi:uncharacterized pyridoxamine 5'-phosphate oxidase family protein